MIVKSCLWCAKEFSTYPSVNKSCCCKECSVKHRSDEAARRRQKTCQVCGVSFIPKHPKSPGFYCSYNCMGIANRKERVDRSGYWHVRKPEHPRASSQGYVAEQTLIMESHLGRYLEPDEVVHHINHVKKDNRIKNLELMKDSDHRSLHMSELNNDGRVNTKMQRSSASSRASERNAATSTPRGRNGRFIKKL